MSHFRMHVLQKTVSIFLLQNYVSIIFQWETKNNWSVSQYDFQAIVDATKKNCSNMVLCYYALHIFHCQEVCFERTNLFFQNFDILFQVLVGRRFKNTINPSECTLNTSDTLENRNAIDTFYLLLQKPVVFSRKNNEMTNK